MSFLWVGRKALNPLIVVVVMSWCDISLFYFYCFVFCWCNGMLCFFCCFRSMKWIAIYFANVQWLLRSGVLEMLQSFPSSYYSHSQTCKRGVCTIKCRGTQSRSCSVPPLLSCSFSQSVCFIFSPALQRKRGVGRYLPEPLKCITCCATAFYALAGPDIDVSTYSLYSKALLPLYRSFEWVPCAMSFVSWCLGSMNVYGWHDPLPYFDSTSPAVGYTYVPCRRAVLNRLWYPTRSGAAAFLCGWWSRHRSCIHTFSI